MKMKFGPQSGRMAKNAKKTIPSMSKVSLLWNDGDPFLTISCIESTLVTGSAQTGITFHRLAFGCRLSHIVHHQDKFTKKAVPELCHHLLQNIIGNPRWQIHHIHCSMTATNLECLAITPQKFQELSASRAA